MKILGIDTDKPYTLTEAKKDLEKTPNPKFGDRDHNTYFYEMWPLIRVMDRLKANATDMLRFSDGKRTDDGMVIMNGVEQGIQFTEASNKKQGKHEAIRMEHKEKYGRAPAVQDMKWEGKKSSRTLPEQNLLAFKSEEILEKLKSLILDAINKKLNDKYKGMWLGIVFDDYLPSPSEKTNQEYATIFESVMQEHSSQLEKIYAKVFFIAKSGKYITHYDLNFTDSDG